MPPTIRRLSIEKVEQETKDAVSIHFSQPGLRKIQYQPGQYLTLLVPFQDQLHYRPYSLWTTQRLDDTLAISVKRVEGGLISNFLNDTAKSGQVLDVIEPMGHFTLVNTVKDKRKVVLLGGGSGITPLMAILRSVLYDAPDSEVYLYYSNRNEDSIIFRKKLDYLKSIFPQRFFLRYFLTRSAAMPNAPFIQKRIDHDWLSKNWAELSPAIEKETLYYLCGPDSMMNDIEMFLKEKQISPEQIFKESFNSSSISSIEASGVSKTVNLHWKGKKYTVQVPQGVSILDAGLESGIALPYSCRSGECATCMGRIMKGVIEERGERHLTPQEWENGYRLLCQSLAVEDDTDISIGGPF